MEKSTNGIVRDYIQNMAIAKLEQDTKRQEEINKLFALRKNAIKLVERANKTLIHRKEELKEINEGICIVQGHTYTDWEMHDGVLDRTWFYTRYCKICGKEERVEDEPKEFKEMVLKKRQEGYKK